jgi:hypothetical protein
MAAAGTEARPTFTIKAVGRPSLAARQIHLPGGVQGPTEPWKCGDYPDQSLRKLDNAPLYPHFTDMAA